MFGADAARLEAGIRRSRALGAATGTPEAPAKEVRPSLELKKQKRIAKVRAQKPLITTLGAKALFFYRGREKRSSDACHLQRRRNFRGNVATTDLYGARGALVIYEQSEKSI